MTLTQILRSISRPEDLPFNTQDEITEFLVQGPDVGEPSTIGTTGIVGGGSGVSVSGGTGVLVSGGMGVLVSGGIGVLVSGGIGVFVSEGTGVRVGGIAVFVAGSSVRVGGIAVRVGSGLGVEVRIRGSRVFVGCLCVGGITTTEAVTVGEEVGVRDGRRIGVSSKLMVDNACTVKAETVLILFTAKSTILAGPRTMGVGWLGDESAIAEVMHKRLIPKIPAATTPNRLV